MAINNVPVVPIFAVALSELWTQLGLDDDDVVISIQAEDGHSAFVSGVACSYSLPPNKSLTSGTLIVGQVYTIQTYVAGDDFANVGGDNTSGDLFIATGTTPTNWSNGSTLSVPGNLTVYVGAAFTGQVVMSIDLTQDGPFTLYFQRAASIQSGDILTFVLTGGGPGCVSRMNLLGVGGTAVFP